MILADIDWVSKRIYLLSQIAGGIFFYVKSIEMIYIYTGLTIQFLKEEKEHQKPPKP